MVIFCTSIQTNSRVPGVDEFEQVGPGLVEDVFPGGDGGGVAVAGGDELVRYFVHRRHALHASALRGPRELAESLAKHLKTTRIGYISLIKYPE